MPEKKKVLLLGSGGFVGRNMKEHLSGFDTYELLCPRSSELDLLDENAVGEYLKAYRPDVVINAAVCKNPRYFQSASPKTELEQDLRMFFNLEKYHGFYGKMIYFGSGAEYDKRYDICSAKEGEFINGIPDNDYGFAKYIIGRAIENSENIYNLRIFGLFGKYENWRTTFISGACCKALKGLPITIRQNVYFDYLYIDDFCNAVRWFVDNEPKYHTYNMSSGRKIDLVTIAETVKRLSGNNVPIYVCQPGLGKEYTADNTRLREENRYFYLTDFETDILNLLKYYSEKKEIDILSLLYQ